MEIPHRNDVPLLSLPQRIEEKYDRYYCSSTNVYYCNECKDFTLKKKCCMQKTKKASFTKCIKCNYCFIYNFYPRQCLPYLRT